MEQVYLAPIWIKAYPYSILVSQLSVMVFVVLSGFLIGKSITRETSSDAFSVVQYAIDRAWRIVPPLLLSFAVMAVLFALAPFAFPSRTISYPPTDHYVVVEEYAVQIREILSSALFVNGFFGPNPLVNGPLWSLAFEVWLYTLAGIAAATRRSKFGLVLVIVLFALLAQRNHNFAAYSIV
jgi:peptidoglycan/LPS O-acetylase OafA/YrhL